jgi:mono/diheme cytochrome c family protein
MKDRAMAEQDKAAPEGEIGTTAHEWDGIQELNTPLPRWWLWSFYGTIVFAIGYCIAYPAIPLAHRATAGVLNWSSRGQLATEQAKAEAGRASFNQAVANMPVERIPADSEMMRAAVEGGHAAFKVNCVQCHGTGASGRKGYPNLTDDDWLWGGDIKTIRQTLEHGVRQPDDKETRLSQMPAFGRDGILTADQYFRPARRSPVRGQLRGVPWRQGHGQSPVRRTQSHRCHLALRRRSRDHHADRHQCPLRRDACLEQEARQGDAQYARRLCPLAGRR